MSQGPKTAFIGLALILVLFVAAVGYGTTQPTCSGPAATCAKNNPPTPAVKTLGRLFAKTGSRVDLPQPRYMVAPGGTVQIPIPEGKGLRPFRIALDAGQGSHVAYVDRAPASLPHEPGAQPADQNGDVPGNAASPDEPRQASFTASHAGGVLTVTCKGAVTCAITQP